MLQRPSRNLWVAAIAVSIVCVGALAYGLVRYWDEPPAKTTLKPTASESGSGFGLGLMVGLGAGIAIASVVAARRPKG